MKKEYLNIIVTCCYVCPYFMMYKCTINGLYSEDYDHDLFDMFCECPLQDLADQIQEINYYWRKE